MDTCPRPIYVLARMARRFMPLWLVRRLVSCEKAPPCRISSVFEKYHLIISRRGIDVRGKDILEFGGGTYNPASLGLLGFGSRQVRLLDPYCRKPQAQKFEKHIISLCNSVNALGGKLEPRDIYTTSGNEVIFNPERIKIVSAKGALWDSGDSSCDLILSNGVIQYIRQPQKTAAEIARCLRPGGLNINFVHIGDSWARFPFDMMKYSKNTWQKFLTTSASGGGYVNRLRLSEYKKIFEELGLTFESCDEKIDLERLRALRPKLHPDFQRFADEDLATTDATLILQKPTQ